MHEWFREMFSLEVWLGRLEDRTRLCGQERARKGCGIYNVACFTSLEIHYRRDMWQDVPPVP